MAGTEVVLRTARLEEAAVLAEIEGACWPRGMAADAAHFQDRMRAYPEGQIVAERSGRVVGAITAQRITAAFLAAGPVQYDRLTDRGGFVGSHDPRGELYQLVTVSVAPEARGFRLGRTLVDHELAFARGLPGVRRLIGVTRPAGYHRHQDVSIEDYVALRREDGRFVDPVLDFHLSAGARVVSIHPDYRRDAEALDYGVLIEYPLGPSRRQPTG